MVKRSLASRILALFVVLAFNAAELMAVANTPHLPNPGDTGISKQQQIQLGRKAEGEVYQQMPVLPDSNPVARYVQQLGQQLASVIPQQDSWPYQFHVIQQKEINAFALPGGPIFVNVGTITAADNVAELAGVMAHEMAHVYMQHSIKQAKKSSVAQGLAGLVGAIFGRVGGVVGALGQVGAQVGGGMVMMKYSREDEAQADAVGAIIMYKAGYNPRAMADFFQKLERQGGSPPQLLSDHPNPGNRMQAIEQEIQNWPPENYRGTSQAFQQAKLGAEKIKAYTAQEIAQGAKQGTWAQQNQKDGSIPADVSSQGQQGAGGQIGSVTPQDVRPSGSFTNLQAAGLSISYPTNWKAYTDPNGSGATVAPPAGVSQGAIAYGIVINREQPQYGSSTSLDQAVQNVVRSLQQSNPDLRANGAAQPITVNGVQGRSLDMTGVSPVQQNGHPVPEHDWLVVLPDRQGGITYMIFIAPQNAFGELQPTYQQMLRSVRLQ